MYVYPKNLRCLRPTEQFRPFSELILLQQSIVQFETSFLVNSSKSSPYHLKHVVEKIETSSETVLNVLLCSSMSSGSTIPFSSYQLRLRYININKFTKTIISALFTNSDYPQSPVSSLAGYSTEDSVVLATSGFLQRVANSLLLRPHQDFIPHVLIVKNGGEYSINVPYI